MENNNTTPFSDIYNSFLSKVTDDMYMELTKEDTYKILQDLLLSAIPNFEFPRFNSADYNISSLNEITIENDNNEEPIVEEQYEVGYFNSKLTNEEINILATYMVVEWLGQQLASIENTRMKYSGTDFKFTSQANHIQKLITLKKDYEREGFHLQRLYKRRTLDKNGQIKSTFDIIMKPLKEGDSNNDD